MSLLRVSFNHLTARCLLAPHRLLLPTINRASSAVAACGAAAAPPVSSSPPPHLDAHIRQLQTALRTAISNGQLDTALELALQCRAAVSLAVGSADSTPAASATNNLALVHKLRGELDAAASLYSEALQQYERLLGTEHPSVAAAVANLGQLRVAQAQRAGGSGGGDFARDLAQEAFAHLQRALELRERGAAADPASVAVARYQVATPLRLLRRFSEAEQYLLQAVRELRGPGGPSLATALNNLGFCLKESHEYARGAAAYEEAIALRRSLLGRAHQDTIASMHNLAELRRAAGDEEGALSMQREIMGVLEGGGDVEEGERAVAGGGGGGAAVPVA